MIGGAGATRGLVGARDAGSSSGGSTDSVAVVVGWAPHTVESVQVGAGRAGSGLVLFGRTRSSAGGNSGSLKTIRVGSARTADAIRARCAGACFVSRGARNGCAARGTHAITETVGSTRTTSTHANGGAGARAGIVLGAEAR